MAEQQRHDFADLVRERRAQLDISLRELARRSVDPETGEPAKLGWISKLERGERTEPPTQLQMRAIAAGLGVPLRAVQEAVAAQYLGIVSEVWSGDHKTRVLVARIGEMSDEERAQIAELADMTDEQRAQMLAMAKAFRPSSRTPNDR